jgi:tetratricopeptide (TPR) repeat protein
MRKPIIITALLAIATFVANAQSVEDALKQLGKNNQKAKEAIDKVTADPSNAKNADAWYAKAQIYSTIATDDKLKASVPDAYEQAFDAFQKSYEIDPNNKRMMLDLYKTGFVAYEGIANKAAAAYQANDFAGAFEGYTKTLRDGDWLRSKDLSYSGYKVPAVDTGMVFMAGYTAMKLKKEDSAVKYFTKLADAKIGKEADYVIPYQFLTYHYKTAKDSANFKKYDQLGRELYPNDSYFVTIQLDWARENDDYPALFQAYDNLIAQQPDSLSNRLSYASEMFNYLFIKNPDTKPADYDAVVSKIEEVMKPVIEKDYEPASSNLILAQLFYNEGLDLMTQSDKIKGTKPDDTKKKADLKAAGLADYEKSLPYTEKETSLMEQKGVANLDGREKQTLRNMYIMLGDIYTAKGDKVKSAEYDKKYTSLK